MLIRVSLFITRGNKPSPEDVPYGFVDVQIRGVKVVEEGEDIARALVKTTSFYEGAGMDVRMRVIDPDYIEGPFWAQIIWGEGAAVHYNPIGTIFV